jgi:hypothetical protein
MIFFDCRFPLIDQRGSNYFYRANEYLKSRELQTEVLYSQIIYAMQCFSNRESENIKERRKIYAARDFSDKYDHALFKYQIKFVKFLIISFKRLIKFLI